jgi:hypothetical protein
MSPISAKGTISGRHQTIRAQFSHADDTAHRRNPSGDLDICQSLATALRRGIRRQNRSSERPLDEVWPGRRLTDANREGDAMLRQEQFRSLTEVVEAFSSNRQPMGDGCLPGPGVRRARQYQRCTFSHPISSERFKPFFVDRTIALPARAKVFRFLKKRSRTRS